MRKRYLIGVDEVGRGPLAGPVTVAAIAATGNSKHDPRGGRAGIRNPKLRKLLRGIKDSKQLSAIKREEWNLKLTAYGVRHRAFNIAVASVGPRIIDNIGISRAARLAVGRCLSKLNSKHPPAQMLRRAGESLILLDGSLYAPRTYLNQTTIIKGDEKVSLIAAASIIAKVRRDKAMVRLHEKFPKYGFGVHKGYGTKAHIHAIKKHGLSPIHRQTFCSKLV